MLAASVNYPLRGAVTWKAIVGTNVASDALSNIASPGVVGGALIVVGDDYGEGSSVIQERSHAVAMKSSLVLLDPRPDLPHVVRMVEQAFPLSEAAATPVMLQLRIRACHLQGSFVCSDNVAPAISMRHRLAEPAPYDPARMSHPPATFAQERLKVEQRLPAARATSSSTASTRSSPPMPPTSAWSSRAASTTRSSQRSRRPASPRTSGTSRLPILVLNATYPLAPDQIVGFCAGKRAVLVLEEGHPEFIELELNALLARAGVDCACAARRRSPTPPSTPPRPSSLASSASRPSSRPRCPRRAPPRGGSEVERPPARRRTARRAGPAAPAGLLHRRPERPVFAAMKLVERELGPRHVSADIGCHCSRCSNRSSSATPSPATAWAWPVRPASVRFAAQRPLATVGDGGFWHNGFSPASRRQSRTAPTRCC